MIGQSAPVRPKFPALRAIQRKLHCWFVPDPQVRSRIAVSLASRSTHFLLLAMTIWKKPPPSPTSVNDCEVAPLQVNCATGAPSADEVTPTQRALLSFVSE